MQNMPIMSVSGIRGKVGETIDEHFYSLIAYIQTKKSGGGKVIVGRDTRPSGSLMADAVFKGIIAAGGTPIDIGIAPTPTTCFATKYFGGTAGIIITASHNPLPYNGYKMVHKSGRLYNAEECSEIYDIFNEQDYSSNPKFTDISLDTIQKEDAVKPHINAILKAVDTELIKNGNIKIAVDSINGAAGVIFPKLLQELSVEWVGVNNKLDGNFTHNPEPRPEYLTELSYLLQQNDTWGGFVFDPDADRLATMGEKGESISEEMTLAMALENVLSKTPGTVATNLSTSMIIDKVAKSFNSNVIRTKIGEANVVEGLKKNNCIIGGEGNGGVIYPNVSTVRDGLCGMALILELMAKKKSKITGIVSKWPTFPIVKEKIELGDKNPAEVIKKLSEKFKDEKIDLQDGIKIIRDTGWVHLRASNTEPIMRCYAEGETEEVANTLAQMVMNEI